MGSEDKTPSRTSSGSGYGRHRESSDDALGPISDDYGYGSPTAEGLSDEPSVPNVAYFTLAPDWICEVISPSTGRIDRTKKMPIYAREGVAHLWLVDPLVQTVEVYRLDAGRWIVVGTHVADEVARIEPFAEVDMHLARWWPPLAPPT